MIDLNLLISLDSCWCWCLISLKELLSLLLVVVVDEIVGG